MTKRVAVIFEEDIYCQRGMFNAIRNRIKYLKDIADFDIDVYVIGRYEPWYIRILRHTSSRKKVKSIELDGIEYHTLWYNFTLIDYLLDVKFHRTPIFSSIFYRSLVSKIYGYDLISAHSTNCGLLASRISKRDNVPFCVTWHGSDIHTLPLGNKNLRKTLKRVLMVANCNFFVSKKLNCIGRTISPNMKSQVLYNGHNDQFKSYSDLEKLALRRRMGVAVGTKVIAFVGNLVEIKNPQLLPPIFSSVQRKYDNNVLFWIIGSGKMQIMVENLCRQSKLDCVFWGSQPADSMPDFMNCIDVLVLPSQNEGLPLVVVEALACGANVVGSDVGGISEAIGDENVFLHGDRFVDNISDRIVYMLNHNVDQPLAEVFEWRNTAKIELEIYKRLFDNVHL